MLKIFHFKNCPIAKFKIFMFLLPNINEWYLNQYQDLNTNHQQQGPQHHYHIISWKLYYDDHDFFEEIFYGIF